MNLNLVSIAPGLLAWIVLTFSSVAISGEAVQLAGCLYNGQSFDTWAKITVGSRTLECRPDGQWFRIA